MGWDDEPNKVWGKNPGGANDRKASRGAAWSWLDLTTWQMSNSSAFNVLQLQSNERGPERRPGHQLPMTLQLSVTSNVSWAGMKTDIEGFSWAFSIRIWIFFTQKNLSTHNLCFTKYLHLCEDVGPVYVNDASNTTRRRIFWACVVNLFPFGGSNFKNILVTQMFACGREVKT